MLWKCNFTFAPGSMSKMKKLKFNLTLNLKRILRPCNAMMCFSQKKVETQSEVEFEKNILCPCIALVSFSRHLHTRPRTLINLKTAPIVIVFNTFLYSVPSNDYLSSQWPFVIGYNCVIFPHVAYI